MKYQRDEGACLDATLEDGDKGGEKVDRGEKMVTGERKLRKGRENGDGERKWRQGGESGDGERK